MDALLTFWDNPIFIKHARSRLRRSQVLTPAVIVLVLCVAAAYNGFQFGGFASGVSFGWLMGLQFILLGIQGSVQVSASIGGARESGILDFHRVSPLSPLATSLGFFFGAPVREYALFLITIPFCLFSVAQGTPNFLVYLQIQFCTLLVCWTLQAISLLTALTTKKPRAGGKGMIAMVIIVSIFGTGPFSILGTSANMLDDSILFPFFGLPLHWLINALLYTLPTLGFIMLASVRKMQSERAHALSKPQAVACLATQLFLTIGGTWLLKGFTPIVIIVLYVTSAFACLLVVTITPNLGEYTKGVRRAERRGISHLSYWDDLSLNRVALMMICLLVLVGSTIVWQAIAQAPADPTINMPAQLRTMTFGIPIATAVLSIFYFGSALQYFALATPRRSMTLMSLFIFLAWFLPMLVGALIAATTGGDDAISAAIIAISPIAGIGMSSFKIEGATILGVNAVEVAAISPALIFFVLFNTGVTAARRKALTQIHTGPDRTKPRPPGSQGVGTEADLILH